MNVRNNKKTKNNNSYCKKYKLFGITLLYIGVHEKTLKMTQEKSKNKIKITKQNKKKIKLPLFRREPWC